MLSLALGKQHVWERAALEKNPLHRYLRTRSSAQSHTSTCSFLENEPIGHHDHYRGKRVKRGLCRASTGHTSHAEVTASYNILRRYAPPVVANGVSTFLLRPSPLRLPDRQQDRSKQLPHRRVRK